MDDTRKSKAQLIDELQKLRRQVEEALRKQTRDLAERFEELDCLAAISQLRARRGISLEEILQGTVDLIPPAFQYPEITCARIIAEGQEFRTNNFEETIWKLASNMIVHGDRIGTLEVCYLGERQESDEGPFLKEERRIINIIAERLGQVVERMRAEEELRKARDELEQRVDQRTADLSRTNELLQKEVMERERAEERLSEMFTQLEKSHADLLSIINKLRVGTAIIDEDGRVTFLSQAIQRLVGKSQEEAFGGNWGQLLRLKEEDKARLERMTELSPNRRKKFPVSIEARRGRQHWVDIEVQDDPRNPQRKIVFLYDMSEVRDLRSMLDEKAQFHHIVGKSEPMRSIYQQIQEISQVDWTVLVEGDTGTGKELVARAVHFSSRRKQKPFIPVNCGGLTDSLLASQLFGHKRGAFTGAVEDHEGLFEAANGGTLFLDEIGDVSTSVQASLLRALEEREITRVGESRPRKVDARIIAATQRNLSEEVEEGNFRLDLFYRIRVTRIRIPALRERRGDIPLLVEAFLGKCRAASGKPVQEISDEAMRILSKYNWPGNVRELRSAVEFAVIHCRGSVIHAQDLPSEIVSGEAYSLPLIGGTHEDEKARLLAALERAGGNRKAAARLLGIGRSTLYRRLAGLNIEAAK